jgi:hypothetical protein
MVLGPGKACGAGAVLVLYRLTMIQEILQSFKYPFVGERFPKRFLLGCAVSLIPLLGGIVGLGYALKTMKEIMAGNESLPRWEDFIGLFLSGIKVIGIFLVYGIAFFLPFSLGLLCILAIPTAIATNIGFLLLALSGILFLSSAFIVPMALIFMIHGGGSMREALRFEDVLITIRNTGSSYIVRSFVVWLIALLFALVMSLVISIWLGHLFVMAVAFYFLLIASFLFGREGREVFSEEGVAGARRIDGMHDEKNIFLTKV